MQLSAKTVRARLLTAASALVLTMTAAGAVQAQERAPITIAPQSLTSALQEFGSQTARQVMFSPDLIASKKTAGVSAATDEQLALAELLTGTGLGYRREGDVYLIVRADTDPQSGSAAGDGADGTVEALIVTAQKREEDIQDVPIAISAFSQEALERSQVAGGADLMTQVPNMTFTKTNFSSYSIQIRGIGTQAISATTDAAVAVAFNNSSMIRNRFFEQEFYDLARVEVLRGPQGTLYGRNATAGVVNIISAKPTFGYAAKLSGDLANYNSTRLEGMVNVPLVDDKVALRLAGAWTRREGYSTNQITGNPIDGRDLWSTRLSLRFEPTDSISADLIWEHFQEDDDRLRSGKQLCHTHVPTNVAGFTEVDGVPLADNPGLLNVGLPGAGGWAGAQGAFSQGCTPASLYSPDSFGTPNGFSLPYYLALGAVGLPVALSDPYESRTQSSDLRVIESAVDPQYLAKSDVVELQLNYDIGDNLALTSETAYAVDDLSSKQDFNRFNTARGAWLQPGPGDRPGARQVGEFGGIFCDPQLGCSDRLVTVDLSTAKSRQISQELRLSSDFDGPFNFSLGANFLRYDTVDRYYVFSNSFNLFASLKAPSPYVNGVSDNRECLRRGLAPGVPGEAYPVTACLYMDSNPIGSLTDDGHNYFLSKNPYKLISYAVFGEAYYNLTENLKLTGGLRWTVDKKEAPRLPSWLLASESVGYPVSEVIRQDWSEPTGRLAIDWKPDLAFTDETLLYASYARGYKAGGANPPGYTFIYYAFSNAAELGSDISASRRKTFAAEYVDAFEVGAKNTLLDGSLTLNLSGFYYDYDGYQISQIVDRSAFNQNFDADIWGAEIEAEWRPTDSLRLGFKGGYENTRLADGSKAIDLMDRTAGDPDWVVVKPFPTFASNCILPAFLFAGGYDRFDGKGVRPGLVNLGGIAGGNPGGCELAYVFNFDPVTAAPYVDLTTVEEPVTTGSIGWHPDYEGWDPATAPNHGEGIDKDIGGNELPNAPHFTATVTADYTVPLPHDWLMTLHSDLYYQSEAWTRIFNTEGYDKLKAYTNVNLAAIFTNEDLGWRVMAYVKNVFDRDSITGAFLNSDDTGLTTNVFLTEPRLYGLRVTKDFEGGPWWAGADPSHPVGEPYPLTVELGGQIQDHDAPYETLAPTFRSAFSQGLDFVGGQHRRLDTGDSRDVAVTYRPSGSPWSVSARYRHGRADNAFSRLHRQHPTGPDVCGVPAGSIFAFWCDPTSPYYNPIQVRTVYDWSDGSEVSWEQHATADFSVGRDVGIGGLKSRVALDLRYAQFKSQTKVTMAGIPDWDVQQGFNKYLSSSHYYAAAFDTEREFEGAGPVLSWDASQRLLGDETTGHIDIDWSVAGGVLFGRQETAVAGYEGSEAWNVIYTYPPPRAPVEKTPLDLRRDRSQTVPLVDLRVGLSYEIQRLKLSTGYRWERYFDVLDAGFKERRDLDRTIEGPYFKLAVGFGG